MKRRLSFVAALMMMVFLTFGIVQNSHAALATVSPATDPVNGFPGFYQDGLGLQLGLCTNAANCIVTPPVAGNAFSQTIGFGGEMFYFFAESDGLTVGPQVAGGTTDLVRFRMIVEAAFGSVAGVDPVAVDGDPAAGTQIVFARLNLGRIVGGGNCPAIPTDCVLQPGATYTVDYPYGTFNFVADASGEAISSLGGQAFRVEDGGAANLDFTSVLLTTTTNIGPFLTAVAPAAPAGFIGNGLILQTVTGSPVGTNSVTITGPNIGGPGVNSITTDQFALAGQVAGVIPTFADVPATHPFFTQISAIATAGITGGCQVGPPALFCPDAPVTRKQMAVFMETSLGVVGVPPCAGTVFADVSPLTVTAAECGFIEDFAARGITGGCGNGNFCPNQTVTRGQMAVFIEAALGVTPAPACAGNRFGDVNLALQGAAFCGFIEDFSVKGITGGCQVGPPALYCPSAQVTRGEMAVFLVAAPPPLTP